MAARRESSQLVSALIVGAAVALAVGALDPDIRTLELRSRDFRMKLTIPAKARHPEISLVVVTQETIDWANKNGNPWPWHRELYAYLFKACGPRGTGASAVLFDFLTLGDPGEGEDFVVDALRTSPPVFVPMAFKLKDPEDPKDEPVDRAEVLERYAVEIDNDGSVDPHEPYSTVLLLPRPKIAESVAGACDVSTPRDEDNVIRSYRLFSRFRGRYYPTFVLSALMAREGVRRVEVRNRVVRVGRVSVPVDREGRMTIRYYKPEKLFELAPASKVIEAAIAREEGNVSSFDLARLKGRIVVIGTNAPALFDLKPTPVTGKGHGMAGCEIQAVALANALNGDMLRESPSWISLALLGFLSVAVAVAARFLSVGAGAAAGAGFLAGYFGLNLALFKAGWVFDLFPQVAAMVLAFAAASALNFLFEGRQRMRIKRDFQRYLSPRVVEKILQNPDALRLEGERKPLTVFFMDFAGFTSMSEKVDPAELVRLISDYHHEAAEEIFRTEGTIDKYIGDAIMAFWNDPIEQPDHALRACLAALGAQRRLRELAGRMRERGLPEMRARIGINSGLATVGNMGARGQVNYTAIGDEVNLASRLEGVNKEFGTEIIVSEAALQGSRERLEARELALIRVKGRRQPVRIFELLGLKGEVPPERLEAARRFEQGLADFRARRFQQAWQIFMSAASLKDAAAEPYLGLCERFSSDAPPPDWDGSYQMESK